MANPVWQIPSSDGGMSSRMGGWPAPIQKLAAGAGSVVGRGCDGEVCKQQASKPASQQAIRVPDQHGGWWMVVVGAWSEPHGLESWAPCRRGNSRTSDSPTVSFLPLGCQPSLIHWPLAEDGMYSYSYEHWLLMLSMVMVGWGPGGRSMGLTA